MATQEELRDGTKSGCVDGDEEPTGEWHDCSRLNAGSPGCEPASAAPPLQQHSPSPFVHDHGISPTTPQPPEEKTGRRRHVRSSTSIGASRLHVDRQLQHRHRAIAAC